MKLLYIFIFHWTINFDRSNLYKIKNTHTYIHTDRHTQVDVSNIIRTSSCVLPIGIELQIVSNTLIHSRHLGKYRFWLGENRAWSWCEWRGLMNFQRVNILNEGTWKKRKGGKKKLKRKKEKKGENTTTHPETCEMIRFCHVPIVPAIDVTPLPVRACACHSCVSLLQREDAES